MRGWRKRGIIGADGEKLILKIRRLKCAKCNRIHHELPDCVVPYKHHCAETIEKIINGETEGVPCDNRTIRWIAAWWAVILPYFLSVLKSHAGKYENKTELSFRKIIYDAVKSNNWVCTRFAYASERQMC